ncbi:MAG: FAD-binding oxidoreductase [Pyrinomonadaceae bacterium]
MQIKTETDELQDYLSDASNLPGGNAEKVYLPETVEDISQILKEAENDGIAVTFSGARTGTVGGAVPFEGIVISTEKLTKLEIDKEQKRATVGAGVVLRDLQIAAKSQGLFYPPDPTEWSCQIGGTIATNASGARSFKYGATRNFVNRLRVVLANGEILAINRGEVFADAGKIVAVTESGNELIAKIPSYVSPAVRKDVAGFMSAKNIDLIDLFIGSEGVLGVIVEAELALLEKPEGFFSGTVFFVNMSDLLGFVRDARNLTFKTREEGRGTINATSLEFFDKNSLEFIGSKYPETPAGMSGAIFFEQDCDSESDEDVFEAWNELLEKHNAAVEKSWFAVDESDLQRMREFRHALPVAVNERVVRNGQRKIGTDMAVPDKNFDAFLKFYFDKLNESGLDYVIFGHIGDNHLHANMLPKDDEEMTRARHLYGRFIAHAVMLGGTVSAEHGIGKLKARYLYVMYGERYINEMIELKRAFDSSGILGKGNMFIAKP